MFHGSIVALVTPMDRLGQIDYAALSKLVDFHLSNQTDAILVAGTTGESATLTKQEAMTAIRYVIEQVSGQIPVIAGTGVSGTAKTIALTQAAEAAGADGCLLMAPAYIKPTQEGLYQHFKTIADAVAIPQILYNVPGRTASDILPETVARLADCPNIVGIKEASGDLQRVHAILEHCGAKLDVYSGDDELAKATILAGGKGVISVTANVAPKLCHQMCQYALAGERENAESVHQQLLGLHQALFVESNPIPVKWALQRLGMIQAGIRLPLTPLSKGLESQVEKAMIEAGVLN